MRRKPHTTKTPSSPDLTRHLTSQPSLLFLELPSLHWQSLLPLAQEKPSKSKLSMDIFFEEIYNKYQCDMGRTSDVSPTVRHRKQGLVSPLN